MSTYLDLAYACLCLIVGIGIGFRRGRRWERAVLHHVVADKVFRGKWDARSR